MSPEQARGRAADKRTDVWAFGCVLFEMLSGKKAFQGEDVTDIIAAVVRAEPDWSVLPAAVPERTSASSSDVAFPTTLYSRTIRRCPLLTPRLT